MNEIAAEAASGSASEAMVTCCAPWVIGTARIPASQPEASCVWLLLCAARLQPSHLGCKTKSEQCRAHTAHSPIHGEQRLSKAI